MNPRFWSRLDDLEGASDRKLDIGGLILEARVDPPKPTHTRWELEALSHGSDLEARIARGWLRIGFVLPDAVHRKAPAIKPESVLPAIMGYFYDKPLEFILFAYEWGTERALQVVKLPSELQLLYDSEYGPEMPDSRGETVVVGVDPARFGDDRSVIRTRAGRDARSFAPIRLSGVDTMTLASRVAEHVNTLRIAGRSVIINVDGGGVGGGVVDRLRSLGYDVNEVQFGSRAMDPRKYANRRAEIWGAMREWLEGGALPNDEELATDLTSIEYGFNGTDQILLEKKEDMKKRGLASPDDADALALTFAVPVPVVMPSDVLRSRSRVVDYDPYAYLSGGHDPLGVALQV